MQITVPDVVRAPRPSGEEGRLGWPRDVAMRGVYMRGPTAAGHAYVKILDKLAEHGMNAIVLDAKDTDGILTYASKVPLAVETGATRSADRRPRARRSASRTTGASAS